MECFETLQLSRQCLYDDVWELSVKGVAEKYDVSYDRLLKVYRNEHIPRPGNSWRVAQYHGTAPEPERPPLTGDPNRLITLVTNHPADMETLLQGNAQKARSQVESKSTAWHGLRAEEQSSFFRALGNMSLQGDVSAGSELAAWAQTLNRQVPPMFSETGCGRAVALVQALLAAVEQSGGQVLQLRAETIRVLLFGVEVPLRLEEHETHVKQNREEKKQPDPRVLNGKLSLYVGPHCYRDLPNTPLEVQLPTIFCSMAEVAIECGKQQALLQEEEERQRQKAEEREERDRYQCLLEEVSAWRMAAEIREYVNAVVARNPEDPDTQAWAKWALEKAKAMDPLQP